MLNKTEPISPLLLFILRPALFKDCLPPCGYSLAKPVIVSKHYQTDFGIDTVKYMLLTMIKSNHSKAGLSQISLIWTAHKKSATNRLTPKHPINLINILRCPQGFILSYFCKNHQEINKNLKTFFSIKRINNIPLKDFINLGNDTDRHHY